MDKLSLVLDDLKNGKLSVTDAEKTINELFFKDLGHTVIDTDRERRTGHREVVFCAGKTVEQIMDILDYFHKENKSVLCTRMSQQQFSEIGNSFENCFYDPLSRIMLLGEMKKEKSGSLVAIISAGTSDRAVSEEAALTAEFLGRKVIRINDVGVAGLHRLLARLNDIRKASVVVVVAGMEGALASVVGGLVSVPVIAVPTSVGYGASLNGIAALLSMLNSCSSGISVVNIDNGFGAGYQAALISA